MPVSCTGLLALTPVSISAAHYPPVPVTYSLSSAITVANLLALAHGWQGPARKERCKFSVLYP